MKHMMLWLLALMLLCACQPTPTTEYVVNKADRRAEQAIAASPDAAGSGRADFPDRWEETFDAHGASVTVSAAIEQKADGIYPVYRTARAWFTAEDAERIFSALLPSPVSYGTADATKAEVTEEFRQFLATVDAQRAGESPDDTVWSEEEIAWMTEAYIDEIAAAPDERTETPASDYSALQAGQPLRYTLSTGETAAMQWGASILYFSRGGDGVYTEPEYRSDARLGEPIASIWQDVALSRADAEAILWDALKAAQLTDFAIAEAYPANLTNFGRMTQAVATGWQFALHRDFGGYPAMQYTTPTDRFAYGESDPYNRPIGEESILVFVSEKGVQSLGYYNPKTVVGLESADVGLLPFDEVRRLVRNAFSAGMPGTGAEVYRIVLTTMTLRVRDSEEYRETPCWFLLFDTKHLSDELRQSPVLHHDALVLNAIDGSIVHPQYGY